MVSSAEEAAHRRSPATEDTKEKPPSPKFPGEEPSASAVEVERSTPLPGVDGGASSPERRDGEEEEEDVEETSLALADELFEKGSKAIEEDELVDAVDCLSRALEIRVAHYGELAFECGLSYYKYGCALLYKAQEEADPLGNVPKGSSKSSTQDATVKNVEGIDSSKESVNNNGKGKTVKDDEEEEDGGSEDGGDDEDLADEDDSDLDLAWKMLDVARAIFEKQGEESLDKVKILSALAEVSLEREDFDTSLSDYNQALALLEKLVEPDHRRIIELNLRICLALEVASRTKEAALYCEKSIALCKSHLQRLRKEVASIKDSSSTITDGCSSGQNGVSEPSGVQLSLKEEDIVLISGFQSELETKLQDLQHAIANPRSVLSEILKLSSSNLPNGVKDSKMEGKSVCSSSAQNAEVCDGFDNQSVSTTSAKETVTHLGVVGRGVKRASAVPVTGEPTPKKSNVGSSAAETLNSIREDS